MTFPSTHLSENLPGVVACPLWIESNSIRRGSRALPVWTLGMGPRRSAKKAGILATLLGDDIPVVVAGVAGALCSSLQPGDLVVANQVLDSETGEVWPYSMDAPQMRPQGQKLQGELIGLLQEQGLTPRLGTIASARRVVTGRNRTQLRDRGALIVDTETAWILRALGPRRPVAVVRCVADTPAVGATRFASSGIAALRGLKEAAPAIGAWLALAVSQANEVTK